MIYLTQYLCPLRHCIMASAFDGDQTTTAQSEAAILARMVELKINPWCGICGSAELHFETGRTRFPSLAVAMPILKIAEEDNLRTRKYLEESGASNRMRSRN